MLLIWIDKRGRLNDELSLVENGEPLGSFGLDRFRLGPAVVGLGDGGVFAISQNRTDTRCAIAWGELYNRAELIGQLQPTDSADTPNDAQVLDALIEQSGPQGLADANGQFAFVGWNASNGKLIAATDLFAILPLRYYEDDDRLIVASDARMILACPGVDNRLNPQSIYDYVAMSIIPSPQTVFRSIRKLPPRHILTFDGQTTVEPYCRLRYPENATGSPAELASELRDVIAQAVALRRGTDPPDSGFGAFLSGGLDSSTVLGMLAGLSDDPVRAYTIGFGESRFDEMDYARLAAKHFNAEHHTRTVTADDTSAVIDALLDEYDEPFGNSSAIPVYWCARLAAESGTSTLYGGDGGDEIFAGNPQYLRDRYFQIYSRVPRWLRHGLIEPTLSIWPLGDRMGTIRKARSYVRRANTPNPERIVGYGFLETVPPADVFDPDFLSLVDTGHPMDVRRGHFDAAGDCSELNRILNHELALVVADNDLRKVTQMSARAGVRVVYPMLDPNLVALAGRIPAAWHLRGFKLRAFYKRAMRGFLPDPLLTKQKMGFGLPISVWLKQDPTLRQRMNDVFASSIAADVFKAGFLPELRRGTDADETNYYGSIAWVIMILIEWLDRFASTTGNASLQWGVDR